MRKTTHIFYDEMDVSKMVHGELQKAKLAWLKEFTEVVAKFKDEVMTKLDQLVGDIQDKREEQILHQGQHDEMQETLDSYDKRIKKLEHPAL